MLSRAFLAIVTLAALPSTGATPGDIEVRVTPSQVYLRASGAPLSAVLERVAALTGMKLQFEGTPPTQRMVTEFTRSTPIEAVLTLLDGLDLAYAAEVDTTGTRLESLLIASRAALSASGHATGPGRPGGPPPARTVRGMPVDQLEPEPPEPEDEDVAPPPEPEPPPMPGPTPFVPAPSPTPTAPAVNGPFVYAPFPSAAPAPTQAPPSPAATP